MRHQTHILNGDALRLQFPRDITGEFIVMRECLVDGSVEGKNLDELFATRATFVSENYDGTIAEYYDKVVSQFQKMDGIKQDSDIHLWFEDDLFCQVNLWFVAHLLISSHQSANVYLIRPKTHNQYGFGGLDANELLSLYKTKTPFKGLKKVAGLWELFQNDDSNLLLQEARELESLYAFILPAVKAHIERKPTKVSAGRPIESLKTIMKQLETEEFAPVFREFSKRESIYGFGDMQVKRLIEKITSIH